MDVIDYAEDILYDFCLTLPIDDQKIIFDGSDILRLLTDDAEEEIKEEIWNFVKNEIKYALVVHQLKLYLKNHESDSDSESEQEQEQEESDSETRLD